MAVRVRFSFDQPTYRELRRMQRVGKFPDTASVVKRALVLLKETQTAAADGYTEVLFRKPETCDARILVRSDWGSFL